MNQIKDQERVEPTISYQIVPGSFCGQEVTWIYESHDGAFQRHHGPYWYRRSAQDQIKSWEREGK
jgi:hypothetical protein